MGEEWTLFETLDAYRCVTEQNKTKQNKTKQNKTKQNKTKQNKTKQNKTKQNKKPALQHPPGTLGQLQPHGW
jgi:hypothetical protein